MANTHNTCMMQKKNSRWKKNLKKNLKIFLITFAVYFVGVSIFTWYSVCPQPDDWTIDNKGVRCSFSVTIATLTIVPLYSLTLFPSRIPQIIKIWSDGGIFAIGYGFVIFIFGNPPVLLGFFALLI